MESFFGRSMVRFREFRSTHLNGVGRLFVKIGFGPNILTGLSLVSGLLGVWFLFSDYWLFVIFSILHLFFDAMDGVVARLTRASEFGKKFDYIVDNLIAVLLLLKVAWFLTDIYPALIAGLYGIGVVVHIASSFRAPMIFTRSASIGVLILASMPGFLYVKELLVVGYLVVGVLSVYSLSQQLQYVLARK